MSIKKQYLKSKPLCKVTFRIPEEKGNSAGKACVVGDFNDWVAGATPMKRTKGGAFSTAVDLAPGRSYQFRYLLGQSHWENDTEADGYLPSGVGDSENSVIHV